ncbi:MAG: zinc metalloprotease HtpX, partial [Abditibacteriales bacterium]|nr:zinc metalloprotease HtpX [Abditibacteriales bacterium]MDW8365517.1 zinc metalloprotease HtpX [Abditibacteriales bacterium]
MNTLKTTILLAALTALLVVIGKALGGTQGMVIAFGFALLMNAATYWFSDRIVLMMHGAREIDFNEAPDLHRMVEQLAAQANIPKPKIYLIPDEGLNAFATGRDPQHGVVAYTEGILRSLDMKELAGVTAHELAHIKHRDILISTIAAVIAGAISMLGNMAQWAAMFGGLGRHDDGEEGGTHPVVLLFWAIVAPIAAVIIQLAISRAREYAADEGGARICGNPLWLASALRRLEQAAHVVPTHTQPATAHLFIVNPLRGGGIFSLFSTHPPVAERIARLEAMAGR